MKKTFIYSLILGLPTLAFAAGNIDVMMTKIMTGIVNPVIYLLMFLATIFFLWGMLEFIKGADEASKRKTGADHMLWGIIGLVIMVSAKAIVGLIISMWQ